MGSGLTVRSAGENSVHPGFLHLFLTSHRFSCFSSGVAILPLLSLVAVKGFLLDHLTATLRQLVLQSGSCVALTPRTEWAGSKKKTNKRTFHLLFGNNLNRRVGVNRS